MKEKAIIKQTNKTRHGCRVLTSGTSTVSYIMKCIMRGPHSPHAALDLRSGHWCIPQRSKSHMCITSLITVSYQGSCRSKRWSRASECIVFFDSETLCTKSEEQLLQGDDAVMSQRVYGIQKPKLRGKPWPKVSRLHSVYSDAGTVGHRGTDNQHISMQLLHLTTLDDWNPDYMRWFSISYLYQLPWPQLTSK